MIVSAALKAAVMLEQSALGIILRVLKTEALINTVTGVMQIAVRIMQTSGNRYGV